MQLKDFDMSRETKYCEEKRSWLAEMSVLHMQSVEFDMDSSDSFEWFFWWRNLVARNPMLEDQIVKPSRPLTLKPLTAFDSLDSLN